MPHGDGAVERHLTLLERAMAKEFVVRDRIVVRAPMDRCFLLSTSIEIVEMTLGMHPVAAESKRSAGLIEAGDQLVWRGWIFGLPQMHETLITGYERPRFFQDTMGRGRFANFHHDHHFTEETAADGRVSTLLEDAVHFALPLGVAGAVVGRVLMVPHVQGLVRRRFALLKRIAEGEEWRRYLPAGTV